MDIQPYQEILALSTELCPDFVDGFIVLVDFRGVVCHIDLDRLASCPILAFDFFLALINHFIVAKNAVQR